MSTRYLRGVDWDQAKAQLAEKPAAERRPIHAPDEAGRAAHVAGLTASALRFELLAASSPNATREQRAEAYARAFTAWAGLVREMAVLGDLAPTAREAGEAWAERLQDFAELAA